MSGSCQKSCKFCEENQSEAGEGLEVATDDDDCVNVGDDVDCAQWASEGWCVGKANQIEFMQSQCACFCNFCEQGKLNISPRLWLAA